MQLRRLTRVFARRTRRFVKPIDCRRYHTISEGSDQTTSVQAQSVQANSSLRKVIIGFTMHRPMRDFLQTITLNILGKVFNRHFEIFLSFFQENRICISCKLSPLHEMSNPVFLVIKQITIFFLFFFGVCNTSIDGSEAELAQTVVIRYPRAPIVVSLSKTLYPRILVLVSTQEDAARMSAKTNDNIM